MQHYGIEAVGIRDLISIAVPEGASHNSCHIIAHKHHARQTSTFIIEANATDYLQDLCFRIM